MEEPQQQLLLEFNVYEKSISSVFIKNYCEPGRAQSNNSDLVKSLF